MASNLIEKWKQVVLTERPAGQQQLRQGPQPAVVPVADTQQQPIVLT